MNTITCLPFFKALNNGDLTGAESLYWEFTEQVYLLCCNDSRSYLERIFTLNYTHTELSSLCELHEQREVEKKCTIASLYP